MRTENPAIRLARLAIAYQEAHAVYFPAGALEMAELASEVLQKHNVRYWISPGGDSITCTACRLTSRNPHDVSQKYCGNCHRFHDAPL